LRDGFPHRLEPEGRVVDRLAAQQLDVVAVGGGDPPRGTVALAGEPVEGATKWAGQSQRDDWRLFEDYNRRNVTAAYSEFEWDQ